MVGLWQIYCLFFKMGIFTFGGGYAMLPILQSEVVRKRHYVTEDELLDYYSIGQCTPGIIAVNAASFIGYKLRGLGGLLSATLGVISPSLVIIVLIAMVLRQYMDNQYLQWMFGGIRISVTALIINTVWDMWRKSVVRVRDYIVFAAAFGLMWCCGLSAALIVLLAAGAAFIPDIRRLKK
ncbi:MAG: chromate transporter [Alphaproteobacteria bacterium]|nr:chromate transporter [Alphaproteobacteria bacterium]